MSAGRVVVAAAAPWLPALALAAGLGLVVTGCGSDGGRTGPDAAASSSSAGSGEDGSTGEASGQEHPDVEQVELTPVGDGAYDVAVTISSPYDTPERYADGWRVLDAEGNELGTHELTHDHASEQPFTRTQYALEIPEGVEEVTVEGRDLQNGFGGGTATVTVPRA